MPTSTTSPSSSTNERPRFNSWALLFLFSTLALTAHETDDSNANAGANKLVTAVSSITLILSAIGSIAHLGFSSFLSSVFVGTLIEGLVALVSLALWAGCLPVVMDPRKGLAQMYVGKQSDEVIDYQPIISNANLYFCSWGAAICVLSVFAQYVRERLSAGNGGAERGGGMGYTNLWYLLGLASVVVVIEGMRFKNQVCVIDGGAETATCGRNTYGLVTGIIGLIVSVIISLFSTFGKDSALVTTISSFLCAILYTICAGLLTFDKGPATYVGNQYLAAWSGFFLSFMIFGSVVKEFMGVAGGSGSGGGSANNVNSSNNVEEEENEMDTI
eukprot:CAMPEP_0201715540 /NCGR_PEP_ID=MMETSP0593-20130828/1694_1 /ASSEMBLY_ACC=CAM_ASM_000672 /TAXON_ID=267983 /ORGANISM="Skeletonema japonicum, Strain CCMP2506" /LENGTH=329 /DNA_ID=CAMNT_0048205057 /DNA_START=170 /DNA_END=1159 /DNA_ORIENTATION=+